MRYIVALIAAVALVGCAATDAQQGKADQGGSVGGTPTVAIYIGTGGGITTTIVPTPTAAPAATSEATAEQRADQTTDVKVDPEAVGKAVKTLGGVPDLPAPAPAE